MKTIRMSVEEWYEQAVEIKLFEEDDFLKIKETLTRIGIGTTTNRVKRLFQTCHILHKRGKYYIVHFKELFLLDGKTVNINEHDFKRRNKIISLLEEWGLLEVSNSGNMKDLAKGSDIKIISHKEKANWEMVPKYTIGNKK